VLIGPMAAGKTTIAGLLSQALGAPHYELDDRRWDYYHEIGYDNETAGSIRMIDGFAGLYRYWKPFEIHAVERVLADCRDGIISFGAGHSVYEDPALFERARRALAPVENVILLLPCEDPDEAVAILVDRYTRQAEEEDSVPSEHELAIIDHFVRHPSNRLLTRKVIYTQAKTPQQTCDEILQLLAR